MKSIRLVKDKLYCKQFDELFKYKFNYIPFFIFPLIEFNILQFFDDEICHYLDMESHKNSWKNN